MTPHYPSLMVFLNLFPSLGPQREQVFKFFQGVTGTTEIIGKYKGNDAFERAVAIAKNLGRAKSLGVRFSDSGGAVYVRCTFLNPAEKEAALRALGEDSLEIAALDVNVSG